MQRCSLAATWLTLVCLATVAAAGGPGKLVHWQPDLKSAHKLAVAQGKPILLVFGAEWCTYCHKLEEKVIDQPEMAAYINANFVPVHLDADKEKRIVEILDIDSLPCTVVLSPGADLLGKFPGYADAKKYTANLTKSQQAFRELQTAAAPGGAVTR